MRFNEMAFPLLTLPQSALGSFLAFTAFRTRTAVSPVGIAFIMAIDLAAVALIFLYQLLQTSVLLVRTPPLAHHSLPSTPHLPRYRLKPAHCSKPTLCSTRLFGR